MADEKEPRAMAARKTDEQIREIHERLYQGERRMTQIEGDVSALRADISENTELTRSIADSVSGIVAFSDDLALGSRLLCRMAKGITFLADKKIWIPVLVCYVAIYFVTHDGNLPDWVIKFLAAATGL